MKYQHSIALKQFDRIATIDKGASMPDNELLTLQVELFRWQTKNFSGCTDWQMALGMIEEAGELDEAESEELRYDAVGDVVVFGCQLLTLHRAGLNIAIEDADHLACLIQDGKAQRPLVQVMGRMAKVVLKGNQKIRGLADKAAYREAAYKAVVDLFAGVMGNQYTGLGPVVLSVAYNEVLKRGKGHNAIPT